MPYFQSKLDSEQVLQNSHDETNQAIRTIPAAGSLITFAFDYVSLAQNSTQDIYTYKSGGSSGTTVGTITITYTSSAKSTISTVAKT